MRKEIAIKLDQIVESIYGGIDRGVFNKLVGLYDGKFGVLLFLFYYSKYSNIESNAQSMVDLVEKSLNRLGEDINCHTFCSGLAGTLYLFEFLRENDFVDIDTSDVEKTLEDYLTHKMRENIQAKNYDFMHGALGVGLYFLKKETLGCAIVYELVNFLEATAVVDSKSKGLKWESVIDFEKNKVGYNISLSHGISSIILFLCRVLQQHLKDKAVTKLLYGAVAYILSQEIEHEKYGSYFPSFSIESSDQPLHESRLSWCYGDLGVAYSLYYAGKITGTYSWIKKGLDILIQSTQRRSQAESKVVDAGICHGSMSMVMIYRRMYLETKNEAFLYAIEYWLQLTLDLSLFEDDGLAGYKTYVVDDWKCDYSLLSGISGIGLGLLSYLYDDPQTWDEIFLL